MKDNKIRNNLIVGMLGQGVTIIFGILIPKLVLVNYGSEVNGLLTSITNIYAYIAIVEAGIAAAACPALYKAIAANSRQQINAIISAANRYYRRIGTIYFVLVILFAAVYPVLIQSELPYMMMASVIFLNGIGNVICYFFHAKYQILLRADGKQYVRAGVDACTNAFKQIAKIVLISLGYNVVVVQISAMVTSVLQMLSITYYIRKNYSWIDLNEKPNYIAISQSKHALVHEISYLITANIDVVLLTFFTTLKTVSVYSMYMLLVGMLTKVLRTIKDALEFKIGYEFNKDRKRFLQVFGVYELYYVVFAFSLFTVLNYFFLPFIQLYTKDVTDADYTDRFLAFLFIAVNLLSAGRYPSEGMVHISGCFKETEGSAIIETVINLVVSLILVRPMGIYGVLIGTIAASLYRSNYLIWYANIRIIGRNLWEGYKGWFVCILVFIVIAWVSSFIKVQMDTYMSMIVCCIPYTLSVMAIYFVVTSLVMREQGQYAFELVRKIVSKTKR